MKKIFYNKLIRDKIPDKIHTIGSECETRRLSKKDFERELLRKVEEEAIGLLSAKNKKELIKELADVIDVIEEIKSVKKITPQEISQQRKENMRKKGGFAKRLFLVWSSKDQYTTNEVRDKKHKK